MTIVLNMQKRTTGQNSLIIAFNEFYNNTDIVHEHKVALNPDQNGRVEILQRTLISNADAMLADIKLTQIWEDAVATTNYT